MDDLFAFLGIVLLVVVGYVLLLLFVSQVTEKGRCIVRVILVALTVFLFIWGILVLGLDLNVLWLFLIGLIFISIVIPCWIITRPASWKSPEDGDLEVEEPPRGRSGLARFIAGFILGRMRRK